MTTIPGATVFPLCSLQPVADASHAWVAMVLGVEPAGDAAAVLRLFEEWGLAEALGPLACVLPADGDASWDEAVLGRLPAAQLVLCGRPGGADPDQLPPWLARGRRRGFRILFQATADTRSLPAEAAALALDCAGGTPPAAGRWLHSLPGPHLAFGVDTYQRFEQCGEAGFTWLAGDYPLHPSSLSVARGNGPTRALLLRLLALVVHDADTRELEAVFKQDPELAYHLLRLVNSAAFARPTRIDSFDQAITMLGRRQLQRWLQLLLFARVGGDQPSPLLPRAAFRAGLMEFLCREAGGGPAEQDHAFMVGLLSLLDALFGRPLAELLTSLNLPAEVTAALLARSGRLGQMLAIVTLAKRGPAPALHAWLKALDLGPADLARGLVDACRWTVRITHGAES